MISQDFQDEVWNKLNSIERRLSFAGGGGSYAPSAAQYVVMAVSALLPNERRLQAAEGIALADGGAGGDADLTLDINGLVEDAAIASGDFLVYYDTVAGDHKKVDLDDLGTAIGAAVDHGALIGLGDDDHTQYLLADGTRDLGGTWNAYADIRTDRWLNHDSNTFLGTDVAGAGNLAHGAGNEGWYNTAIGAGALNANTTGYDNVAIGYVALALNTTGVLNMALGSYALTANTTGGNNVAMGFNALAKNTIGQQNTAVGPYTLLENTEGNYNTAIGYGALGDNKEADSNVAIGYNALKLSVIGTRLVAVGVNSLDANTQHDNTAVGYAALGANTSGRYNVAVGTYALDANTTVNNNTAIGFNAMTTNSTGSENTAIGRSALEGNTIAGNNVAVGYGALAANTSGTRNVAIGAYCLDANADANDNTAVGYAALGANTTGTDNIAMGGYALDANTTGDFNVAIGRGALGLQNPTGAGEAEGNIGVGYKAGDNITTASYCIIIGDDLNAISATANYQVNIGGIYRGHIDDGEVYLACPAAIAADADLENSEVTFAVDEVNDELDIKVKYSGGGVKSGVVALA